MGRVLDRLPLPAPNLIGLGLAFVADRVRPLRLPGPRPLHQALGATLAGAGVLLEVWAVAARADRDIGDPQHLATSGPYGFSRNPMYVGWHAIHLGSAVAASSVWGLLTWPGAACAVHREVLGEERSRGPVR